ncbi:hypothetical protein [Streptomyces sp. NPDC098781]|uniref:hypothetical protein n=1 Tax=Streptomyces sp. NPDC098781 TaxID=3366097 RepID=UPI00382F6304
MNGFADRLMIRYQDPVKLDELLVPLDDAGMTRIKTLLAAVYEPGVLEVRSTGAPLVTARHFQVPVTVPLTVRGSWEKVLPAAERARTDFEIPSTTPAHWIDLALDMFVPTQVAPTSGALEAIGSETVARLTEDDFVAKFGRTGLDELLRLTGAADFRELQANSARLYELRYADPPPFDPAAPARRFRLRVSVLFFADFDLAAALRRLVSSRHAVEQVSARPDAYDGGELLAASAWLAVFPAPPRTPDPASVTEEQVSDVLAAEGFVAAFEDLTAQ